MESNDGASSDLGTQIGRLSFSTPGSRALPPLNILDQMKILSRLLAESVIQIRGGSAHGLKGRLMSRLLADLSSVAEEAGLGAGEIWIERSGRIRFSKEIPKELHQRFRNVIASH